MKATVWICGLFVLWYREGDRKWSSGPSLHPSLFSTFCLQLCHTTFPKDHTS